MKGVQYLVEGLGLSDIRFWAYRSKTGGEIHGLLKRPTEGLTFQEAEDLLTRVKKIAPATTKLKIVEL